MTRTVPTITLALAATLSVGCTDNNQSAKKDDSTSWVNPLEGITTDEQCLASTWCSEHFANFLGIDMSQDGWKAELMKAMSEEGRQTETVIQMITMPSDPYARITSVTSTALVIVSGQTGVDLTVEGPGISINTPLRVYADIDIGGVNAWVWAPSDGTFEQATQRSRHTFVADIPYIQGPGTATIAFQPVMMDYGDPETPIQEIPLPALFQFEPDVAPNNGDIDFGNLLDDEDWVNDDTDARDTDTPDTDSPVDTDDTDNPVDTDDTDNPVDTDTEDTDTNDTDTGEPPDTDVGTPFGSVTPSITGTNLTCGSGLFLSCSWMPTQDDPNTPTVETDACPGAQNFAADLACLCMPNSVVLNRITTSVVGARMTPAEWRVEMEANGLSFDGTSFVPVDAYTCSDLSTPTMVQVCGNTDAGWLANGGNGACLGLSTLSASAP